MMSYQMQTQALLEELALVFPPVEKPDARAVVYHESGCRQCDMLRDYLEKYSEPTLPDEAVRYLNDEWSCLSPKGMRWVLPSYLRYCILTETKDGIETEMLVYSLGPALEHQAEERARLRGLTTAEVECLLHFLEWCSVHPEWSTYCPDAIARARAFVESTV
jgi:hypothetical protein